MNQQAVDQIKAQRDSLSEALTNAIRLIDVIAKQRDEYRVDAEALAAENKVLREALTNISEESTDPGAVECAVEALRASMEAQPSEPKAEPARLTDAEIDEIWVEHGLDECDPHGFARAIESKIRGGV